MAKELNEDTSFKVSIKTLIAIAIALSTVIGMLFALQADIEEAKELPNLESLYQAEYPSRPEGYNWPRSYEQYKDQVGTLQDDMDEVYGEIEEMQDILKELRKEISSLEKRKRDK